jgi:hypothetical protein
VGKDARSDRRAIRFALDIATVKLYSHMFTLSLTFLLFLFQKVSKEVASSRPYAPTIHALALPSQIPLDLRLGIRDLDEAWLVSIRSDEVLFLCPLIHFLVFFTE